MNTGGPAPVEIERVAETASTNAELLARVREASGSAPAPRALVADRQTAGRGRLGRTWLSTPGASLTFSLAWPFAAAVDLSGLSLAVGVALAEALDPRPGSALRIGLKWPNDLWLVGAAEPGRKLGGVLIETVVQGDARVAVIGVGINLLEQPVAAAATGVAWLAEIDPAAATSAAVLAVRLVPALAAALRRFERAGFAAFAAAFAARDLLRGRTVHWSTGSGPAREGLAGGVSGGGELLLHTPAGIEQVGSGEVSVRPAPGPAAPGAPRSAGTPC